MPTTFHLQLGLRRSVPALVACAALAPAVLSAESDEQMQIAEAKAALAAAMRKNAALESQLTEFASREKAMGESMAAANSEAREYREDYQKIRLQLEALGIDVLRKDSRGLDERLLNAVNDLTLAEERNTALANQLSALGDEVQRYLNTTVTSDPTAALRLEQEIGKARALVAGVPLEPIDSRETGRTQVVSVKADYGLLVLNVGDRDGVRIGTPFLISRKDRPVASAMVVDSRKAISGAIITELLAEGDTVQVGDLARLETFPSLTN